MDPKIVGPMIGITGPFDVRGRSITYLILRLVEFWGRHKVSLNAVLNTAIIVALDALETALIDALSVNPPGPD